MPDRKNILEIHAQGCSIGILAMRNVHGAVDAEAPDHVIKDMESTIRNTYGGMTRKELAGIHPMDVYTSYYKKFGYTYHVLGQLESIIHGKSIPSGIPLVGAMFTAEMKNMLLTAGHDLDQLALPLGLGTTTGRESYVSLSGKSVATVPGDFMLFDGEGTLSSILRGPAKRACITEQTRNVLLTVYAPHGVEEELIYRHLDNLEYNIREFYKDCVTESKEVIQG